MPRALPALVLAALLALGPACVQPDDRVTTGGGGDVTTASGSDPAGTEPATSAPPVEGPAACRSQFVRLRRALHDRFVATGAYPTTPAELQAAGITGYADYTVAPRATPGAPPEIVLVAGSACPARPEGGFTQSGVQDQACTYEFRTVSTAVLAYEAQEGTLPDSSQDLLDASILAELPEQYDVVPGGDVIPLPGSDCL